MIDWDNKLRTLKQMADELEFWSTKAQGRQKLVLGRIADELHRFRLEVGRELRQQDRASKSRNKNLPEWLAVDVVIDDMIVESGDEGMHEDYQDYGEYDESEYGEAEYEESEYAEPSERQITSDDLWDRIDDNPAQE